MKILFLALWIVLPSAFAAEKSPSPPVPKTNDPGLITLGVTREAGPINERTTHSDLERIYGKAQLRDASMTLGEGGAQKPSTRILAKGSEAEVVWENRSRRKIVQLVISSPGSRWHTASGIRVGTSVPELEKLNGKPFKFTGLGWDYGGMIDAMGGALGQLEGLQLVLSSDREDDSVTPFTGDSVNPMSNSPGIDKAGIHVGSMTLYFRH